MSTTIINGKKVAESLIESIQKQVNTFLSQGNRPPTLAIVLIGTDPASHTYVRAKVKKCEQVGITAKLLEFDQSIEAHLLISLLEKLNKDEDIDGIIVQAPLPKGIDEKDINAKIRPSKDVDGFHPINQGLIALARPGNIAATPLGILELIKYYKIDTFGKHCVIVGRSHIVGTPMSLLMSRNSDPGNATVTLCHRYTENLKQYTKEADILITAVGKPGLITADMVKKGAVVIDVGITRVEDASKKRGYALKGDVSFEEVAPKCSYITPVPGGVGPMTIAALLMNTMRAYETHLKGEVNMI